MSSSRSPSPRNGFASTNSRKVRGGLWVTVARGSSACAWGRSRHAGRGLGGRWRGFSSPCFRFRAAFRSCLRAILFFIAAFLL